MDRLVKLLVNLFFWHKSNKTLTVVNMRMVIVKFQMIQVALNNYRDRAKIDKLYNECFRRKESILCESRHMIKARGKFENCCKKTIF